MILSFSQKSSTANGPSARGQVLPSSSLSMLTGLMPCRCVLVTNAAVNSLVQQFYHKQETLSVHVISGLWPAQSDYPLFSCGSWYLREKGVKYARWKLQLLFYKMYPPKWSFMFSMKVFWSLCISKWVFKGPDFWLEWGDIMKKKTTLFVRKEWQISNKILFSSIFSFFLLFLFSYTLIPPFPSQLYVLSPSISRNKQTKARIKSRNKIPHKIEKNQKAKQRTGIFNIFLS